MKNPANFAEHSESDLIVIPTHGLTGLKQLFLGSVTEKVVRRAKCPVFTVRAFGKSLIYYPQTGPPTHFERVK